MAQQIDIVANLLMKVDGAEAGINKLKNSLSKLKMPEGLENSFKKSFSNLDTIFARYRSQIAKGFETKGDVSAFSKTSKELDAELNRISKHFTELTGKSIDFKVKNEGLINAEKELAKLVEQKNKLTADTKGIQLKFEGKEATKDIESLMKAVEKAAGNTKAGNFMGGALIDLDKGNISKTITQLEQAASAAQKLGDKKKAAFEGENGISMVAAIQKIISELRKAEGEFSKTDTAIDEVKSGIDSIRADQMQKVGQYAENAANSFEQERSALNQLNGEAQEYARTTQSMSQQLGDLQQSTQYFFSLRNMINLLKRGIDDAIQSVKELDAAMTETAVVTDYKVSDLWNMLPQYTQLANQLGATTQGAYETMTLYFQQGLDQQAAFEIGAETMKMARIAGLEYAETTDMMTAALRGFNMELNETSAKRVNDVYSELAAITASDTEELGTAMQRTASIAHSAGASFEGATAFLAQAIETTREPAENIGTAMKTIIARFQEMKKNPLEISEVDGEEVDFNKIDTALKSIGVNLIDTNGQFREWDQVMLDISAKWDTLSQSQQRYIATTAAGSRQQSRFIAMVSNYDRTMQLMEAANNSAGASEEQFGKTMDSLESKLNKLHNAWQAFTMGIADNGMIKFAVDGITTLLTGVNKLIDTLSFGIGPVKSILSLFMAFTGLKTGGKIVNSLIGGLGGLVDPTSSFSKGFFSGASGLRQGRDAAQAKAIYQPIVEALRTQTQQLITRDASGVENNSATQQIAGYKDFTNAQNQFRQLFNKQEGFSIKEATAQLSKVSTAQQGLILNNSPGMLSRISRGYDNYLKQFNFDKQGYQAGIKIKEQILRGMQQGQIPASTFEKILPPLQLAKEVGGETGKQMSLKVGEALKQHLSSQESSIAEEVEKRLQFARAQETDWKPITEKERRLTRGSVMKEYADEWLKNGAVSSAMGAAVNKTDKMQQSLSGLGSAVSTAGQAFTTFGMILSNLGLDGVGLAFTTLGTTISSVGMTIASVGSFLPSFIKKVKDAGSVMAALKAEISSAGIGGVLTGAGIAAGAGIALAGIMAISKKMKQEAQDAAKQVSESYSSAIEEINKKESALAENQGRLNELSKGIDNQGRNIGLTNDEYREYITLSRQVADIAPELIRGYDAQGNAIVATGEAIDDLIDKQQKLREEAIKTYTSTSSIKDVVKGIRASDIYEEVRATKASGETNFGKQQASLLAGIGGTKIKATEISRIIQESLGRELNFSNLNTQDLKWISDHYNDIIGVIESETPHMSEAAKAGLEKAFSGMHADFSDFESELTPLQDQIQQYLSLEGLDAKGLELGSEFTTAFNNGLENIAIETALTGDYDKVKEKATTFAKEFQNITGEGSKYREELDKVHKAEEEYLENIDDQNAFTNYKNALEDSANSIEKFASEELAAGRITTDFYNMLLDGANNIRQSATEPVISFSEAINTLSDDLKDAKDAYNRFSEATKDNDFSTASDGMSKIFEESLDDKHTSGYGDNTFWTGAREVLDEKTLNKGKSSVQKWLKENQAMFAEGEEGYTAFYNRIQNLSEETRKDLEKSGVVWDETTGMFSEVPEEAFTKFAEALHLSDDAFAALLSKAQQWAHLDFSNIKQMKAALAQDERAAQGNSGNYYMSESDVTSEIRNAHPDWNDDKIAEQITKWNKEGIVTLPSSETLSKDKDAQKELKASLKDLGIQNQTDLMKILGEKGTYAKEDLEAYARELEGENFNEDKFNEQWKETSDKLENPQLAEGNATLKQIESYVSILAGKAMQERISSGEATGSDFESIHNIHDAVYGKSGEYDTQFQKFGLGQNEKGEKLSEKEYLETRDAITRTMSELEPTIQALGDGYREAVDKYGEGSAKAQEYADALTEAQRTYQSLETYRSNGDNYVEQNGYRPENATSAGYHEEQDAKNVAGPTKSLEAQAQEKIEQEVKEKGPTIASGLASKLTTAVTDGWQKETANMDTESNSRLKMIDFSPLKRLGGAVIDKLIQSTSDGAEEQEQQSSIDPSIFAAYAGGASEGNEKLKEGAIKLGNFIKEGWESLTQAGDSIPNQESTFATKITDSAKKLGEALKKGWDALTKTNIPEGSSGKTTSIINKGTNVVVGAAQSAVQKVQSSMGIEVTGSDKLDEAKAKAEDAKSTIDQGATFKVSAPGTDKLTKAAKAAESLLKSSGTQTIGVKTGKVDTGSIDNATSAIKKTKADIKVGANTSSATSTVNSFIAKTNRKSATVDIEAHVKKTGISSITIEGKTVSVTAAASGMNNHRNYPALPSFGSLAKGTKSRYGQVGPQNKGGLTLTGEKGYEIAWIPDENRSMILGANGPQMLNLPSNAVVWTHEQSKKIMKQKAIPAGSHGNKDKNNTVKASGWIVPGRQTKGGGGSGSKGKDSSKKKSPKSSTDKAIEKILEKGGKVSVWWENIARVAEATQRKVDKNQKTFEKALKTFGKSATSVQNIAKNYKQSLQANKKVYQKELNKANSELKSLDKKGATSISYEITKVNKKGRKKKDTKKETVNLGDYIKYNSALDTYYIDQNAITRVAKKNKNKGQAIKDAAEQKLNDKLSKRNTAADKIRDAQEALDKIADDIYTTFYQWENSLNKIYLLSQRLSDLNNQMSYQSGREELLSAKALAGVNFNRETDNEALLQVLNEQKGLMFEQVETNKANVNATKEDYLNSLNLETYFNRYNKQKDSAEAQADLKAATWALQFIKQGGTFNDSVVKKLENRGYNQDSIERIKKVIEDIDSKREAALNASNDALGAVTAIYSKIEDYQSYIADFENELVSGLEEQTEQQINKLDKLNSSLSKALKDLLDQVKKDLDDRRKAEDNAKTESDISQKRQRLAMLQADTSGGHAAEIAQLQKEISDSQRDYQRSLEDQLIEKLQDQGDKAERQRQLQIDLLTANKDIAKQTGTNLAQVKEWLQHPTENYDKIRGAWLANKGYDEMAVNEQKQTEQEFDEAWMKYNGYSTEVKELNKDAVNKLSGIENTLNTLADEVINANDNMNWAQFKTLGGLASQALQTGASISDLRGIYSLKDIFNAGYSKSSFDKAGIDAKTLVKEGKITPEQLRKRGYDLNTVQQATKGTDKAMVKAGFTAADFQKANKTAAQAVKAGLGKNAVAKAYGSSAMLETNAITGKNLQQGLKMSAASIQKVINKNIKDKQVTQSDMAGVTAKMDINGSKKGGTQTGVISTSGKKIASNKGSTLYVQNWDTKTGKASGKATAYPISKLTVDLMKQYPKEAKEALIYAIQHQKPGTAINKNMKSLIKQAGISGKTYKLSNGIVGSIGSDGTIYYNSGKKGVYKWTTTSKSKPELEKYSKKKLDKFKKKAKSKIYGREYAQVLKANGVKGYATGGIADYTGPAWLDGTPSKPELVLNAQDTKNFVALKDVLSKALGSTGQIENTYGNATYEININVDHLNNDYDVDKVVERVKKKIVQDSGYRNVTQVRNFR